jgi:hypothetical protein
MGVRNGLLAGAATLLATAPSPSAVEFRVVIPRALIAVAGVQLVIVIGLVLSISRKRRLMDVPEHPLRAMYGPRWVRVGGCRSFDFSEQRKSIRA